MYIASPSLQAYETFLFDIDDTLVDFHLSEQLSLKILYESEFSSACTYEDFYQRFTHINGTLWKAYEQGQIPSSEISTRRFEVLCQELHFSYNTDIPHHYAHLLGQLAPWIDGAEALLSHLHSQGKKIGFVTNGLTVVQQAKAHNLGFYRFSNTLIVSETVGYTKPQKEIFDLALHHLNAVAQTTLMLGDSLTSDFKGALNAGLDFCWVNLKGLSLTGEHTPHYQVDHLEKMMA